jgi:hypothetical protein
MSLGKGWGFALSRVKCSSSLHHQAQAHLVTSTSTSSRPKHAMPPLSRFLLPFKYAKERYAGHPLRLSIAALKTIFVFHVFWQYGYSIAPLAGPSMLPTFEVAGDSVIVSRYYRRGRGVKVGDVVSFDSVVEPGESVLKRVLGLQGDYVLRDTPGTTDLMVQVSKKAILVNWKAELTSLGTGRSLLGRWG